MTEPPKQNDVSVLAQIEIQTRSTELQRMTVEREFIQSNRSPERKRF